MLLEVLGLGGFSPTTAILLTSAAICVALTIYLKYTSHHNLPPGPKPWPLIGNLHLIAGNTNPQHALTDLAHTYGGIFTLYFGSRLTVVLNDIDIIREALVAKGDVFSNRPRWLHTANKLSNNKGLLWNFDHWREIWRFAASGVKCMFSGGDRSLERKIHEELTALFSVLDQSEAQPIRVNKLLHTAFCNLICSLIVGKRYEYDDKELEHVLNMMDLYIKEGGIKNPENYIPCLRFISHITPSYKQTVGIHQQMIDYINRQITEHRKSYDANDPRDLVDLFIRHQEDKHTNITEGDLQRLMLELLLAGTDTTANAVEWIIAYLLNYPDIQTRCRQEIMEVIGSGRLPSVKDRGKLPLVEATILEVQRISYVAPITIPRSNHVDATLAGYDIPRDTQVLLNWHAVHRNNALWRGPPADVFHPERWLDDHSNIIKNDAFLPFSIGKRTCVGEEVAKLSMFLSATTLLQRYHLENQNGLPPSLDGDMGIVYAPKPVTLKLRRIE